MEYSIKPKSLGERRIIHYPQKRIIGLYVKAMRAPRVPRVPVEEQYRLIMECRKSGLSDHQWCLNNDINPGTFYNWVKRLRKNGCGDILEKNQMSTYEHSHQEVVKIEMNSISVPTEIDKNTDTAAMELTIGNMNLRISNETDPLLLAKTIQILAELLF